MGKAIEIVQGGRGMGGLVHTVRGVPFDYTVTVVDHDTLVYGEPTQFTPDVEYEAPIFCCDYCQGTMEERSLEADQSEARQTWVCSSCGAVYTAAWRKSI